MSGAAEFEAMVQARAATNQHLLGLKEAIRERVDPELADLLSRIIDNAYGHGFSEGAMHVLGPANDYANATIKRAKEVPEWERNARTGAREP